MGSQPKLHTSITICEGELRLEVWQEDLLLRIFFPMAEAIELANGIITLATVKSRTENPEGR